MLIYCDDKGSSSWQSFCYDVDRFPFDELMRVHLGVPRLESLHQRYPTLPLTPDTEQSTYLHKMMYRISDDFVEMYDDFLKQCVEPRVGEELIFQAIPNFRFQMPASQGVARWHRDSDMGHSPSELNFWVPLTDVAPSTSLWIESNPGSGNALQPLFRKALR